MLHSCTMHMQHMVGDQRSNCAMMDTAHLQLQWVATCQAVQRAGQHCCCSGHALRSERTAVVKAATIVWIIKLAVKLGQNNALD